MANPHKYSPSLFIILSYHYQWPQPTWLAPKHPQQLRNFQRTFSVFSLQVGVLAPLDCPSS